MAGGKLSVSSVSNPRTAVFTRSDEGYFRLWKSGCGTRRWRPSRFVEQVAHRVFVFDSVEKPQYRVPFSSLLRRLCLEFPLDDVLCFVQWSVVGQREVDGDEGRPARRDGGKTVDARTEVMKNFPCQSIKQSGGIALRLVPQSVSSRRSSVQLERTTERR